MVGKYKKRAIAVEIRCVRSTNNETPVEPFDKLWAGSPEYLPSTHYGVIVKFGERIARGFRILFFLE